MPARTHVREDGTITFLPNRLNRQPTIVRGLTANELWITVGSCGAAGLLVGIMLAIWTASIAMAPSTVVASVAAGVFLGGNVLRRLKRGRPDTWLYRQIQWIVSRRLPAAASFLGPEILVTRSGYWTTHRTIHP